jgi:hypothetical protein
VLRFTTRHVIQQHVMTEMIAFRHSAVAYIAFANYCYEIASFCYGIAPLFFDDTAEFLIGDGG